MGHDSLLEESAEEESMTDLVGTDRGLPAAAEA